MFYNNFNRCSNQNKTYTKLCERPLTVLYSNCKGYYFDNPCCPLTYIGNNNNTQNNGNGETGETPATT